jgi:hypothetical protein
MQSSAVTILVIKETHGNSWKPARYLHDEFAHVFARLRTAAHGCASIRIGRTSIVVFSLSPLWRKHFSRFFDFGWISYFETSLTVISIDKR